MSIFSFLRDYWPFRHKLPIAPEVLASLVASSGTEPWHAYAIRKRIWRRHVCVPCGWIADHLPKDALVFEPGCGSGANLLWLARQGFTRLQGADISAPALKLCVGLSEHLGVNLDAWEDNGLTPARLPSQVDALLSVNWLYHIPGASLENFLQTYKPCLKAGGMVVCDIVDAAYNDVANNQYHTNDLKLPVERRRPSEYVFRHSSAQVAEVAAQCGFAVIRQRQVGGRPPRAAYMLQLQG